jgi:hypothetical protein
MLKLAGATQKAVSAESVMGTLRKLTYLENNATHGFQTLPFQYLGKDVTMKLKISAWDTLARLPDLTTTLRFPLPTCAYSGVGSSFYTAGLTNEAYSTTGIQVTDTTANYGIVREDDAKTEIGFAVKYFQGWHFGKSNGGLGAHFTVGPGVGLGNTIRPRLLYGGGISFGYRHKFTFDLVGVAGAVDRLSKAYSVEGTYFERPEAVTVTKLGNGMGLALGYLFVF